jgi:serine/threonine-protein kinase
MLQLQRFASPEPVRRYAPDTPEQLERVVSQLLSKDPADRFPNTQVLARHLQAMTMALSRPASDDFALANEQRGKDGLSDDAKQSIAIDGTQLPSEGASSRERSNGAEVVALTGSAPASQNAATLAAEEVAARDQSRLAASAVVPGEAATGQPALVRPSRFTTLEEDEARRRAEYRRSWVVFAGQLAVFAAVLAGIGGIAWYLSRPASADKLYSSIMSRIDSENGTSLATVERELTEFLSRYPDDPRAATIQGFKERLELDQMEHKLQRQGHSSTATIPSLLPAEQLYLRAVGLTDSSPDEALAIFESLVNLYGVQAPDDSLPAEQSVGKKTAGKRDESARTTEIVEQARRRIKTLRADLARERERQLAALAERLVAADKVAKKDATRAAGIYRAIIDLYGKDAWAAEIVSQARSRLAELNK